MFWNKKSNESGLPDLPQPNFPTIRSEIPPIHTDSLRNARLDEDNDESVSIEKHNLPSFPDSPIKKGFSQTAIKNAVDSEDEEENYEQEENDNSDILKTNQQGKTFKTIEVDVDNNQSTRLSLPPERKNSKMPESNFISLDSKTKEVFVKIDKFQSARKSLSSAREKVQEIELMLKKIRDVRMREEQELTGWERDIESVKLRIEEISKNIFEKL
ncbi:MAG: hypothetical protein AABX35_04080 [Nanoarchaeota archaeon]